jgi:hypothetical protein
VAAVTLLDALLADPLALYPALAALLLAAVGIASGLLRGDVLALARPAPVAWVLFSVVVSFAVQRLADAPSLAGSGGLAPALATLAFAPLVLVALAYGPTPALVGLALTAAWVGLPAPAGAIPGAHGWLAALQLVVIGWLAIAPSPRSWRFVGGAYLLFAHALTWATAGLASVALTQGPPTLRDLATGHARVGWELLALAAALALIAPSAWRALFPHPPLLPPGARGAQPRSPARSGEALATARPAAATPTREALAPLGRPLAGAELRPWTRPRPPRSDPCLAPLAPPPPRFVRRRRGGRP